MKKIYKLFALTLTFLLLSFSPCLCQCQIGDDIDGEAEDDFSGTSVSLSSDGQTVAIGAGYNDGNGNHSGHVRIYNWSGSAWTQVGNDIDGEAANDVSGTSVSLSSDGQTLAIGAKSNDGNGAYSGHVRIYNWSGSAWIQVGNDIDGEEVWDQSGQSVSLSSDGQTVAIGAHLNDGNGDISGHVRIYNWSGSAWIQVGNDIDGEAAENRSGISVSLSSDGQTVAIGADINDGNGVESGHVRIYNWSGSAWTQVGNDIDGEAADDFSGTSVSLSSDGQTVAIGALWNDGNGNASGHVRIYNWSGSAWTQVGNDIDGEAANDWSGYSVSLSSDGQTVAIGAPRNDGNGALSGHVRIYNWSGTAWTQVGNDIDGEAADDNSGWFVSLSSDGQTVAIGAPYNDGNGSYAGHVRIYDSTSSGCMDDTACNYDSAAVCDDGSCSYPGCTDSSACNYDSTAGCDDGSCLVNDECGNCGGSDTAGCADSTACNYDSTAGCDDGSCTYPGCIDSTAVNFNPTAGCDDGSCIESFGTLIWNTSASMYYSDTLEVNIEITGGADIYAVFASLQYDESLLLMVEDDLGDYLGTEVISSPAVDNNGVVEFGATKVGAISGSDGDGLFYTLRFIPVGPIEVTSTQTLLSILNIEAYTSDGLPGALYYPESWEVEIIYEAEVWPGDLNHDLEVNVSDILPIGYFYGETGPARPDATLQWEAQLCPLWDIGMDFSGDGFYKVFADGNGDGEIQLSDQVAVGININQVVNLIPEEDNTAMLMAGGVTPVIITSNSVPTPVILPDDTEVNITLMATTDETNQNDFHGISWSMDFSSLGIDANEAEVDYSNSGMGELNNTMIALDYSSGSQLDIAISRTTSDYTLGTFELCTVTIPVSGLNSGDYIVPVMIIEANDANGASISTGASDAIITVSNAMGCTDPEACNYDPEATEDDGSCQYVLVYGVAGNLAPGLFESETYTYYETEGSTYEWTCTGGVIVSGNGSSQIEVTWAEEGIGELCVIETNAEGCVGEQFCIDVAVIPTNIGEEEQGNISIYPNPASTSFTIVADANLMGASYRLYDAHGKLVLEGTIRANNNLVQTKALSSGSYTMTISNGDQVVTETIVLQK